MYKVKIRAKKGNCDIKEEYATDNLEDVRKYILRRLVKVNDSVDFNITEVKDGELHFDNKNEDKDISPETAFNELKRGLFKKIGKRMGEELSFGDLDEQNRKMLVLKVTNGLISFLFKDKWIFVYGDNEFVVFSKFKEDGILDSVKIPFDIDMTRKQLITLYFDVFKVVKDRYNKYDFAREIFGKDKVDTVLNELDKEGEVDIDG